MKPETIKMLKAFAKSARAQDSVYFNPCEDSGGNYDDAYWLGSDDGKVSLAREILEQEGISYKDEEVHNED